MKKIVLALLIVLSTLNYAKDFTLNVECFRTHIENDSYIYNNKPNAVLLEYKKVGIGYMYNSYNDNSYMLTYKFDINKYLNIHTGVVYGYKSEYIIPCSKDYAYLCKTGSWHNMLPIIDLGINIKNFTININGTNVSVFYRIKF